MTNDETRMTKRRRVRENLVGCGLNPELLIPDCRKLYPPMLIPRFTIRWLLLLMTVSSFFFFILSFAVGGQAWAIAVSLSVGSLLLAFLCYAVVFGLAAMIASAQARMRPAPRCDTPFATAEPPAQIIPPEEPE